MEKEYIYMYMSATGTRLYTPNRDLAIYRAKIHGTDAVYAFEI